MVYNDKQDKTSCIYQSEKFKLISGYQLQLALVETLYKCHNPNAMAYN